MIELEFSEDILNEIGVKGLVRDHNPRIGIEHIDLGDYVAEFPEGFRLDRLTAMKFYLFSRSAERLAEGRTGLTFTTAKGIVFSFLIHKIFLTFSEC